MTTGMVLLVASVVIFLVLMTSILPKMFLKVRFSVNKPDDRGIKRCIYNGKRCVVYECGKEIGKYIEKYLLLEGDKCKILRCKTTSRIDYLDYDVVVFNRYNQVACVVNVKENMVSGNYTRRVELPEETAYVRIVIRKVNEQSFKHKPIAYIPKGKVLLYTLCAILATAFETFVLKVSCAYAFGGVFRESFIRSQNGFMMGIVLAFITGIVALITVTSSIKFYSKR